MKQRLSYNDETITECVKNVCLNKVYYPNCTSLQVKVYWHKKLTDMKTEKIQ